MYAKAVNKTNNTDNSSNTDNNASPAPSNSTTNAKASAQSTLPSSSATSVWQKKREERAKSAEVSSSFSNSASSKMVAKKSKLNKNASPYSMVMVNHSNPPHSNNSDNPYAIENYAKNPKLQKKVESQIKKKSQNNVNVNVNAISQVRLTPLFPAQTNNEQVQNGFAGLIRNASSNSKSNYIPQRHGHHQQQQQQQQQQHRNGHNFEVNEHQILHCPHGNLSNEELINIKIRKRNVCYVVGLPIHVATEIKLRSNEWFGQFGNIATIAINRNSKSIQANSIPAHITYDNDTSALCAINFCNKFIFNDGRKLKATFGTQHYCRWFIAANKKCTNVFCGFRHSWCRRQDIITQKDINDFKAIPAGAYTSRNIENQPMGLRPEYGGNSNVSIIPAPNNNHHGGLQVVNNNNNGHAQSHNTGNHEQAQHHNADSVVDNVVNAPAYTPSHIVSKQEEDILIAAATTNESKNEEKDQLKVQTNAVNGADPYTFYLSNSAATPTGPSPITHTQHQHHTLAQIPTIQQIGTTQKANVSTVGTVNVAQVQPRVTPNIYDSRSALMQQIMNRNATQQIEIDNLKQQARILTEMDISCRETLRQMREELANVKGKLYKSQSAFKELESKHDSLQIKYLSLNEKYRNLLDEMNGNDHLKNSFEDWKCEDVMLWILSLEEGKYKKYENELSVAIKNENVDGECLSSLDKNDLHRLGVTDFKDKKDLLVRIKDLVQIKNEE